MSGNPELLKGGDENMKVEPKKSDMKIHRQIIKKSDYDNNIKKSRNVGIKIGGIIICRLILNIIKQNISDNEKVVKIKEFCEKTIERKGENL